MHACARVWPAKGERRDLPAVIRSDGTTYKKGFYFASRLYYTGEDEGQPCVKMLVATVVVDLGYEKLHPIWRMHGVTVNANNHSHLII